MKWFAFILSIYMVVLPCVPCADAAPRMDTLEQTIIGMDSSCPDETPAGDLCSPLCMCSCCAGFALQNVTHKITLSSFPIPVLLPDYQAAFSPHPYFAIWQPPKV
ncbi:DUF6660 family protein [Adhaeribacter arboris]|uniref:DUF6660 family protein n=1 Tax=Adhaeribacter arboris TaxID=2072846 RepID=UPI0037433527